MPDPPTPSVNGQVVSSPALQASWSMLSFAPATTTLGWFGSMATAGSFCLLWLKTESSLPTVTSVSPPWLAVAGTCPNASVATVTRLSTPTRTLDLMLTPSIPGGPT